MFASSSFLTIFFAFLLTIVNVMVGVSMLPSDNRKKRYLLQRVVSVSYTHLTLPKKA